MPRRNYRLTFAQREVLELLRKTPEISYDSLAELVEIDRNTAMQAIRRLERQRRVVKLDGRGRQPNRYLLTDRLILPAPDYVPTPIVLSEQQRVSLWETWERRLERAMEQDRYDSNR